jgi:hypothetical protein
MACGVTICNGCWYAILIITYEYGTHFCLGATTASLVYGRIGISFQIDVANNGAGALGVFSNIPGLGAMAVSLLCNLFSSCAIGYKVW